MACGWPIFCKTLSGLLDRQVDRRGRGAAAGMALVIVPHEEADHGHDHQDDAENEGQHGVTAAATAVVMNFHCHDALLKRFLAANVRRWIRVPGTWLLAPAGHE